MKKLYFMIVMLLSSSFSYAQNVHIPDANFKAYLVGNASINTNLDNEIQVTEAASYSGSILLNNKGISNLTGIESFIKLTKLMCVRGTINSLDLSKNTALTRLELYLNNLISLDVSNNKLLTFIDLGDNNLTSFDASQNPNLVELYLTRNQLLSLNVKNGQNSNLLMFNILENPNLTCIQIDNAANVGFNWRKDVTASYNGNCNYAVNIPDANFKAYLLGNSNINTNGDNEIQFNEAQSYTGSINIAGIRLADSEIGGGSQMPDSRTSNRGTLSSPFISDLTGIEAFVNLTGLSCVRNYITSLDLSKNTALTFLELYVNDIASLDVSKNTLLTFIDLGDNKLTNFDASQNSNLQQLYLNNNLLVSVNAKNGQNNNLFKFRTLDNPNLSCIQIDNIANMGSLWQKDATANYSNNCNAVLPVTLVTFTAKTNGSYSTLQWQTSTERNHKGFDIYRSGDNGVFLKVGELLSVNGNKQAISIYTFADKDPLSGNNYYKLVQVDNDGKETELGIRHVIFGLESSSLKIYPNPTENLVSITFSPNNFSQLQVLDLNGRVLKRIAINTTENGKQLSLGEYKIGTYMIMLSGNGKSESHKIVKK